MTKEALEKEAEEYLKRDGTKAEQILDVLNEISPIKITLKQLPFVFAMLKQIFQDGAEFGYNKANEWHFVKDGDLPKENIYLVIRLNDENTCYKYCTGFWEKEEKCFHTLFCSNVDIKDIVAWKEIVRPKE